MQRSTTGSILRSTQALCGQLCEKKTLEYGIAYYIAQSTRRAELADLADRDARAAFSR